MPYDYNGYNSAFFGTGNRNVPLSFGNLSRYTPTPQDNQIAANNVNNANLIGGDNRSFLSQLFKNQDGSYNLDGIGSAISGVESLGKLYLGYQAYRQAKDNLNFVRNAYNTNLADQRQTYNTALQDRVRARHFTEGRPLSETNRYIEENRL